jgi:hypothetical protein
MRRETRSSLRPDRKRGVSTFIETFILIGVAAGGSGAVMGAALHYFGSLGGVPISIVGASIRQGTFSAVESVTLVYSGENSIPSLILSTSQAPSSASYCVSLFDSANDTLLKDSCPTVQTNPGTVDVTAPLVSGDEVTVQLVITGGGFTLGSSHTVTITAEDGSQQSEQVIVTPAR